MILQAGLRTGALECKLWEWEGKVCLPWFTAGLPGLAQLLATAGTRILSCKGENGGYQVSRARALAPFPLPSCPVAPVGRNQPHEAAEAAPERQAPKEKSGLPRNPGLHGDQHFHPETRSRRCRQDLQLIIIQQAPEEGSSLCGSSSPRASRVLERPLQSTGHLNRRGGRAQPQVRRTRGLGKGSGSSLFLYSLQV